MQRSSETVPVGLTTVFLAGVAAVVASGCTIEVVNCTDGQTRICSCDGGTQGRQTCTDTGTWGRCDCDVDLGDAGDERDAGAIPVDPSEFSGCSSDADCSERLECDTSLGRCEDPRAGCTEDGDCPGGRACIASRCTTSCEEDERSCGTGYVCRDFQEAGSRCVATCDPGEGDCGADQQCIPYWGPDDGLCRGTGSRKRGQRCDTGHRATGCDEGAVCTDRAGRRTCHLLCTSDDGATCGQDLCLTIWSGGDDYSGVCATDCGGFGAADDTKCPEGAGCRPTDSDVGYCVEEGTLSDGDRCRADVSSQCRARSTCADLPTGARCKRLCGVEQDDPCGSGAFCLPTGQGSGGICMTNCGGLGETDDSTCRSSQVCRPFTSDFGYCWAGGSAGNGDVCDAETRCRAGLFCAETSEASPEPGLCRPYCDPTEAPGDNGCDFGRACVTSDYDPAFGFCYESCDPDSSSNSCPSSRPVCADAAGFETTPSDVSGVCQASTM